MIAGFEWVFVVKMLLRHLFKTTTVHVIIWVQQMYISLAQQ